MADISGTCEECTYRAESQVRKFECRRFPQQATGRSNGKSDECTFMFPPAFHRCGEYNLIGGRNAI